MKCKNCGYEWDNRKQKPKSCPRCKTRFDYPKKNAIKNFIGLKE